MSTYTRAAAAIGTALLLLPATSAIAMPTTSQSTILHATLRPSGDANGSGAAVVRLRPSTNRVCATITYANIDQPFAAHIHRKSDGQVVVDLTGSVTGGSRCVTATSRIIKNITGAPGKYYVNVHNRTYPAGAVQGKLHG